jgi:hypothetical protein
MRIEQWQWTAERGWRGLPAPRPPRTPQLVLFFGSAEACAESDVLGWARERFPGAHLVGCSTAGEILDRGVFSGTVAVTAVEFEHTRVRVVRVPLADPGDSAATGARVAAALPAEGLVHAFVLAEGVHVNGSALVAGLTGALPHGVAVTGGLAGDGERFARTLVFADDAPPERSVVLVGFYGHRLRVGYGSMGGWDPFGPERLVTRSEGNVLYELDGESAVALYRRYLGPHAADLPASGLLFPLGLRGRDGEPRVVRTILGIDEEAGSLVFAGDVPQGGYARLMRANVDRLIDGAHGAASASYRPVGAGTCELGLLISCVGRKLVLGQRVEEEVDSVAEVLGPRAALAGFYSYGEIAPFLSDARCELHNQTMTITTLTED